MTQHGARGIGAGFGRLWTASTVGNLGGLRLPWLLSGIATLTAAALVFRGLANPVVDRALADADQGR